MHPAIHNLPPTISARTRNACSQILQAVDEATALEDFHLDIRLSFNVSDSSNALKESFEQLGREYAAAALYNPQRAIPIITGLRFYLPGQDISLTSTYHSQHILVKVGRRGVIKKLGKMVDIHVAINVVSDYLKAFRLPVSHHYAPSETWVEQLGKRPYKDIEASINRKDLTEPQLDTLEKFRPVKRARGITPKHVSVVAKGV